MSELLERSARSVAELVCAGSCSAVDVARASLAAIERDRRDDPAQRLGAFLTVDAEGALAAARTLDDRLSRSRKSGVTARALRETFSLAGVTVAVKDSFVTRGLRTTCGSKMLDRYVPPFDATVVERLRERGAIIVGKSNMDEFGMGSSTENSAYFVARNPWDRARVPGGSSGGSAVAVSARLVHLALGSDTGGSIRQPAALTGVVGVKPSYARVSRFGLIAFASSLDTVGPIASDVLDAELLYGAIAGHDPRDSTSANRAVDRADFDRARGALRGARIGVVRELVAGSMDAGVRERFEGALTALAREGATIIELSMEHTRFAVPAYYVIAPAECSANLARFDGVRYGFRADCEGLSADECAARTRALGFGAEVKRRVLLGTFALSAGYHDAYYEKAQRVRRLIRRDFEGAFERVDVIATPTSMVLPWKLGERTTEPLAMYEADVCTVPASLAGVPSMSVPMGLVGCADGVKLPAGLQLTGRMYAEAALFELGFATQIALGTLGVERSR